jgi:hypothetical protein
VIRAPDQRLADARAVSAALAIWRGSQSADRTPVETYLRSRGLSIPVPPSIRFHTVLKHPSGAVWPAMVALVTHGADGKPIGIHRTFLARDGVCKGQIGGSEGGPLPP